MFNFATYYYKAHAMTPEEKARVKMHSGDPIVHTSPGATNDAGSCCKRHPQRRLMADG